MDIKWRTYGNYEGPYYLGNREFKTVKPYTALDRILGTVAACEGNFDTTIGYDNTGITWGFLQWTFTSGRLQELLRVLQETDHPEFGSIFEAVFAGSDNSFFRPWGFAVNHGKFYQVCQDGEEVMINPTNKKKRGLIGDICSGKAVGLDKNGRGIHHCSLAAKFARAGKDHLVQHTQLRFARNEFLRAWYVKRRALKRIGSIGNILGDISHPLAGLFFSLWQNNPKHAYSLFVENRAQDIDRYFENVWVSLKSSSFGNWGYKSRRIVESNGKHKPRCYRIAKGLNKYYGTQLVG